jgi:predicted metal-dependent enzyme (double-stranded beta helix superfamily)
MFEPEAVVAGCRQALAESDPVPAVRDVVAQVLAQPDVLPAALGPQRGPLTWFQSPELTVQCLVWPGGVITPPHEHRMWAVIGICHGQEDNTWWRRRPGGVEQTGGRQLMAGELVVLGPEAIHAVANPCSHPTVGIHVYGGDINASVRSEWDYAGNREHPFDLAAVERMVAAMMAQAAELGRELDFDEVRQACLSQYGPGQAQ